MSQSWISIDNHTRETLSTFNKVEKMDIGLRRDVFTEVLSKLIFINFVRSSSGEHGLIEFLERSKPFFQNFQIIQILKFLGHFGQFWVIFEPFFCANFCGRICICAI